MEETKTYVFNPDSGSGMLNSIAPLLRNQGIDPSVLLAMKNNGLTDGNSFIWVIFLFFLMGWNRNGWGGTGDAANAINDTAGRELLMNAIQGNGTAISQLATNLNCDINAVRTAINAVQSSVQNVGNQVGMTGQQVINSIQAGNASLASQLSSCCCENRLAICQQTNALTSEITNVRQALVNGFSNVGYEAQKQTCDILQAGNANTQRIIDTLNCHWNSELQQKYNDARLELSQQAQNAYLISQLKTTAVTGA